MLICSVIPSEKPLGATEDPSKTSEADAAFRFAV